jgi:hypothetical protein
MWLTSQVQFISKSFDKLRMTGCTLMLVSLTACAGPVQQWIVDTRIRQGDVALENGNVRDAELSYRLALRIDGTSERARAGLVESSSALAQAQYSKGDFEGALTTIAEGLKVDPSSVRLSALKSAIDAAKLKREIVISNYPTYRNAGAQITAAYTALSASNKSILAALTRFSYTYDTNDLTDAIKKSYALEIDVARNTNRLITYRQVVSSGVPEAPGAATATSGGSLLPLP